MLSDVRELRATRGATSSSSLWLFNIAGVSRSRMLVGIMMVVITAPVVVMMRTSTTPTAWLLHLELRYVWLITVCHWCHSLLLVVLLLLFIGASSNCSTDHWLAPIRRTALMKIIYTVCQTSIRRMEGTHAPVRVMIAGRTSSRQGALLRCH